MSDETRARATANIFDVARLAGVSHQTVSRVLNDLPNVRPATRARVEQAIAQLNYSPSPAARALVTRRTRTIGLVTPGVLDYGPTSIAMHFNVAARAARYNVETVSSLDADAAGVRSVVEGLLRQRVDAIVLIVVDIAVLEAVRGLDLSIPVVAAASTPRRSPLIVSIDQYRGARSAVRHLAELGHQRILHVAGPQRAPDATERARGWRDELAAHRLAAVEPQLRRLVGRERLPRRLRARCRARLGDLRRERPHVDRGALGTARARHPRARGCQRRRLRRRARSRVPLPSADDGAPGLRRARRAHHAEGAHRGRRARHRHRGHPSADPPHRRGSRLSPRARPPAPIPWQAEDMRIAVTGSTGKLGSVVARELRAAGHTVIGHGCRRHRAAGTSSRSISPTTARSSTPSRA